MKRQHAQSNRSSFLRHATGTALLALVLSACSDQDADRPDSPNAPPLAAASRISVELGRTAYGVPHVKAKDFRSLGYGLAYAYAQDNVCMFADSILTVRGERSQFFGGDARAPRRSETGDEYGVASGFMDLKNEDSDFFFKGYLDIEQLRAGYAAGAPEPRQLIEGYVEGYNRYLKTAAGSYPAACNHASWVRPITVDDMYLMMAEKALHATGQVFAKEFVAAGRSPGASLAARNARKFDPSFLLARLDKLTRQGFGSNALAVGKGLSTNGRGLLLGNPHYPWTSADRFYQAHLTVPGTYDAMGVIIGGIPAIVIGFNRDVAWSHTVTTAIHFTTFRLALDPADTAGTTYLYDGVPVRMRSRTVSVDLLQPDGAIMKRNRTFWFSQQGAVIVKPEAGMYWTASAAYVLADPNRNNTRMLEQWLGIGKANNVQAIKASLDKTIGLPWVNTVAADRDGKVLFADASVVPHMDAQKFGNGCLLLQAALLFDGSRSSCAWGTDAHAPEGIYSPVNGPWTIRSDYVGNSNDSYWLNNPKALLTGPAPYGYSPLYGRVGAEQSLRTRIGFKQFEELAQTKKVSLADMQALAFANRLYAAELVLPELLPACTASGDAVLVQACAALAAWDRRVNADSRGAVLFREFWSGAAGIANKWAVPFSPADPVNTPNSLAPAAMPALLAQLKTAALRLQSLGIPFDAKLGDYQTETRNGVRIPLHGGIGNIDGSYNSLTMRGGLSATGYNGVHWGQSYIQTVSFDDQGPVALAMLTYGQSVDPASPHYTNQLNVYSRKKWPALPFSEEKIKADPHYQPTTLTEQ